MVSVSIMVIITAAIVFRYRSFDSTLLLKTLSYDIGFSVRQAQSYSLGVRQEEGGTFAFDAAYGVSFTPGSTQYSLFQYTNSTDPSAVPRYDNTGNHTAEDVEIFTLGRSYVIDEICYTTSGGETCDDGSSLTRLDISFRRPEYTALFYVEGSGGPSPSSIESASVRITSPTGNSYGEIEVGYAGQISVSLVEE